ncbi:MAG: YicC/YloC family endoribonuclease [Gammaproteobacteria bacterium]|tara:strand:- start:5390 stop:6238 length:849 start_codon:yes stop_codon:yes gene_type:complete
MTKSMTGFGLSSSVNKESEVYIEIKGVNHKFLEVSIKPNDLSNDLEEYIRKAVSKNIIRGRVDIRMKLKSASKISYSIDSKLLKEFSKSLKKDLQFSDNIQFRDIKDIPGIFKSEVIQKTNNKLIKKVFNEALNVFIKSRNEEGNKIKKVLSKKLNQINSTVLKIHRSNNKNIKKRARLFKDKALELLDTLDEGRLEQEAAILALKHDVSEEIDRIFFHTDSLNKELNKKMCSGKKVDFILQELFRESNTLSVKLDDPNLKNYALDMKLFIEEMREQTQNVE